MAILLWAAILETEVFKFSLDPVEAQSVGKRTIEEVGLTGNLQLFLWLHAGQGSHIVKTVCQFYQ